MGAQATDLPVSQTIAIFEALDKLNADGRAPKRARR